MAMLPFFQSGRILRIALDEIDPNPAQPRRIFEPKALRELADSIAQNGLLNPVSVRRVGARFELIAGERRLMAFRLLGEPSIPALVEQADDHRCAVLALVENLQRCDLNFLEETIAVASLIREENLTQRQAADRLGLSQPAIANKLRLLQLPPEALSALIDAGLTERHARALLPIARDERLLKIIERIAQNAYSVKQSERLVADLLAAPPPKNGHRLLILKDLRLFTTTIDHAVDVMKQAGIDAETRKDEDEQHITYTIVIPKAPTRRPTWQSDPAAAVGALPHASAKG